MRTALWTDDGPIPTAMSLAKVMSPRPESRLNRAELVRWCTRKCPQSGWSAGVLFADVVDLVAIGTRISEHPVSRTTSSVAAAARSHACAAPSGYLATAADCDDGHPSIKPYAFETCDGLDEDCDGEVDSWWCRIAGIGG